MQTLGYIKDSVLSAASSIIPGFYRRYNRSILQTHGAFNDRGLGLINAFRLSLADVFVDPRIAPSVTPQQTNLNPIAAEQLARNRPIWDFLRPDKHQTNTPTVLVIVGSPGSGKTTLLQYIALTLAANHQRRYHIPAYIPILLFLRDHIAAITQEKALNLGQLAQDYFNAHHFTLKPPPGWFERQLKRGKCLVMLDGLDEVADAEMRRAVATWVDNQITHYSDCPFVLTTRPQGYRDASLVRAQVLELQPFNAEQVRNFIENWYLANEIISFGGTRAGVREISRRDANDLLQRLRSSAALNALTVNPLLLTMAAMLHRYHGALPGSSVQLYAEICEVLLGRWRQARGVTEDLTAAQKLAVLRPLAAHMMDNRRHDITTQEAQATIKPLLKRIGFAKDKVGSFLYDIQLSSGLLLEREAEHWSFAHIIFQEYLTASYWLERKDKHS